MKGNLIKLAERVGLALLQQKISLATAESCTGGGVAQAITAIPGSSQWFECGWVTYANQAKQRLLDVNVATLEKYGAVSQETALEMVEGVFKHSAADIALSVTGIAGPGGGSAEKPVGLVWFGLGRRGAPTRAFKQYFKGDRDQIRDQAIEFILERVLD